MKTKIKKANKKLYKETEVENIIGCKVVGGADPVEVSKEFNVDINYVNYQKERVLKKLNTDDEDNNQSKVNITKNLMLRIIIGCMLICKGSTEDTARFLLLVFNTKVSIGKISSVMKVAAQKAKAWNESVSLENISIGANDEIFQGTKPILVGVDPKTTYVYLLQIALNREANTWGYFLLEKAQNQGLWLSQAVSDAGKGIIRGVKDVFGEDISYQADIFHSVYDFGKGLKACENTVYKLIKELEKAKKKNSKSLVANEDLQGLELKVSKAVEEYEDLCILYSWINELLDVGGYFYKERLELFEFIIGHLQNIELSNNYLKKSIKFFQNNTGQLLQFVNIVEDNISVFAHLEGVEEEVLRKMWIQEAYSSEGAEYNYLEAYIGGKLGDRYLEIREKYQQFIKDIVRASSIVECINGLIRPYINIKRLIPKGFEQLLQLYLNTRVYFRSRVDKRNKKSPYELLTGKKCGNFLDILCPVV